MVYFHFLFTVLLCILAVSSETISIDMLHHHNSTALIDCLTKAGLNPITPANSSYQNDSLPVNIRVMYQPAALVYPHTTEDIIEAIKCGVSNDVKVNARSGGHSYASFGIGGENGHLIICLDSFNNISLSGDYVTVGGGTKLGSLYYFLWQNGQRVVAIGTAPQIGVGGHLHGGYGFLSRKWGLLLDQVVEMEVIMADGSIVTANKDSNADLFWALRGAPPSFGVITKITILTHPAPTHAATFTYNYYWSTPEIASAAFQIFQHWTAKADMPPDLTLQIQFTNANPIPTFSLIGVYFGDDGIAGLNKTVQPLWDALSALNDSVPVPTMFQDLTWMQNVLYEAGLDPTTDPKVALEEPPAIHYPFYCNSVFYPADALLTNASTLSFTKYTYNSTDVDMNWLAYMYLFGGKNSAISAVPQHATSYNARDMHINFQVCGNRETLPFPADGLSFTEGMLRSVTDMMPEVQFTGYTNHIDTQLSREEAHASYYPTHTKRLQKIMKEVNPKAVFDYPQGFLPI